MYINIMGTKSPDISDYASVILAIKSFPQLYGGGTINCWSSPLRRSNRFYSNRFE